MEPPFYLPSLLMIHPWCSQSPIQSHHSQQHLILQTKQLPTSLLNSPMVFDFLANLSDQLPLPPISLTATLMMSKKLTSLLDNITDQQTLLRLFSQCIIQKLPHRLSADALFHLPTNNPNPPWEEWMAHLPPTLTPLSKHSSAHYSQLRTLPRTYPNIPSSSVNWAYEPAVLASFAPHQKWQPRWYWWDIQYRPAMSR